MAANGEKHDFPFKLYEMLECASDKELASAVSWHSDGTSFVVHKSDLFMQHVAPEYFKLKLFRSFTRQLNLWKFKSMGRYRWYHKNFARGNPDGLKLITRKKQNKSMAPKRRSIHMKPDRLQDSIIEDFAVLPTSGIADVQTSGEAFHYKSDEGNTCRMNISRSPSPIPIETTAICSPLPMPTLSESMALATTQVVFGKSAVYPPKRIPKDVKSIDGDYLHMLCTILDLEDRDMHVPHSTLSLNHVPHSTLSLNAPTRAGAMEGMYEKDVSSFMEGEDAGQENYDRVLEEETVACMIDHMIETVTS